MSSEKKETVEIRDGDLVMSIVSSCEGSDLSAEAIADHFRTQINIVRQEVDQTSHGRGFSEKEVAQSGLEFYRKNFREALDSGCLEIRVS